MISVTHGIQYFYFYVGASITSPYNLGLDYCENAIGLASRVVWGKTPTVSILSCSYMCVGLLPLVMVLLSTTLMYHSLFFYFCSRNAKIQKDTSGRFASHHGAKRLLV